MLALVDLFAQLIISSTFTFMISGFDVTLASLPLKQFHANFAWFVVASNAFVGAWAVLAQFQRQLRLPTLWRAAIVAQLSIFVQAIVGVILFQPLAGQINEFHPFYGFVALATVGIMYAYREHLRERIYIFYGLGSFFLMGLALRAIHIPALG